MSFLFGSDDESSSDSSGDFLMMMLMFSLLPKMISGMFPQSQQPIYNIYVVRDEDEGGTSQDNAFDPATADWTDWETRYEHGHFPGGGGARG
jgi:hypothetical protein